MEISVTANAASKSTLERLRKKHPNFDADIANNEHSQWKRPRVVIASITIIFVIAILVAMFAIYMQPYVKITYPIDSANVESIEEVNGTSRNIPNEQVLWLLVYGTGSQCYYPMERPIVVLPNGNWSCTAYIGTVNDAGHAYDIYVVQANQVAVNEIEFYLNNSVNETTGEEPGMVQLPIGTTTRDKIRVNRIP